MTPQIRCRSRSTGKFIYNAKCLVLFQDCVVCHISTSRYHNAAFGEHVLECRTFCSRLPNIFTHGSNKLPDLAVVVAEMTEEPFFTAATGNTIYLDLEHCWHQHKLAL
jgi:hypothetical protein